MKINKKTILKAIIVLISVAVLVVVVASFMPIMKEISNREGQLQFKNKIEEMGIKGPLLLFLIEAVQMIFVVLPGEPIEVLYGMCFGSIKGAVLLTLAVFINTVIVYVLVKKFGRKILAFFFSESKIEKLENSKLFKSPEKVEYLLIVLFFLPGTPKDLLLYLGALLPIKPYKFILISTFVRFPSVITSTIAGSNITNGKIYISVLVYVVMAIVLILIGLWKKRFGKDDGTREILEDLK